MDTYNSSKQRRSLKEALRTILLKCRRQSPDDIPNTIGSGILRRDRSLPNLPNDSTTAFLLGLESTVYNEHNGNDIPDRFDITSLATSVGMSSTRTLMPKLSLSQFDYHPSIQETRYLQRGRYDSVSSSLVEGASYQASLVTLKSFRSTSTLRIERSSQTLRSDSQASFSQPSFPDKIDHITDAAFEPGLIQCPSPPRTPHSVPPRGHQLRKRESLGNISSPSLLRQVVQPMFDLNSVDYSYSIPYAFDSRFSRPLSVIEEVASCVDEPLTPRESSPALFTSLSRPSTPLSLRSQRSRTPLHLAVSRPSSPRTEEPVSSRPSSVKLNARIPLLSVKHFSSFCALDTLALGCPVTATSRDLRYIFEIGDNFCLNNGGYNGETFDILTGSDSCGNPVTHLVILTPLVIPHSGRSRFTLASMIDITDLINDASSLPELEMRSDVSVDSDPPTPRYKLSPHIQQISQIPQYQLSAENLLGGCFVEEPKTTVQKHNEDIWVNLASEERQQYTCSRHTKTVSSGVRTPVSARSSLSSIDDILDDFMRTLQELHSEFFLLAKSPLDDNFLEICNVSPKIHEQRQYINGHLSKTSPAVMLKLSGHLAGDSPFDMEVRWGTQGVPKHLYCIPLFARSAVTWICFLVDSQFPVLW